MWLPALNISTLEPHSDVNHSRVESTKDAACLESQPLDETSETLGRWAGLVTSLSSHSRRRVFCEQHAMGDGRKGPGACLLLSKCPSVPPVEKHESASHCETDPHLHPFVLNSRLYLPPVGHLADWFFGKPFLILK